MRRFDIVVQGRFHAFHLAQALIERGNDVLLITNYPKHIVSRFGVPAECVESCILHGLGTRAIRKGLGSWGIGKFEPVIHDSFSHWAAGKVRANSDCLHVFSGVAERVLARSSTSANMLRTVMRGSAHIREQYRLLAEEEVRGNIKTEKPSDWMISREEREYESADRIVVLSTFALRSFLSRGFRRSKLSLIPLSADYSRFSPKVDTVVTRDNRIASGRPLNVLMVGSLSLQKGVIDFAEVATRLRHRVNIRFVGDIDRSVSKIVEGLSNFVEFCPRVNEFDLPKHYAWGDIFLFPTIQDGFAVVVGQALASGLPVICTGNCGGPDIVVEGESGWVVPIRSPDAICERILWCDEHRNELSAIASALATGKNLRSWSEVARDFEDLVDERN